MEPEILPKPVSSVDAERKPFVFDANAELNNGPTNYEKAVEKTSGNSEKQPNTSADNSDVSITTLLPTPVLNIPIVADGTTISNNPIAANDDGLIEKEWVNKAKAIISNTRNDPYMREEKVNELQVDYLKKRYGEGLNVIK
jgi:hypothetical protein